MTSNFGVLFIGHISGIMRVRKKALADGVTLSDEALVLNDVGRLKKTGRDGIIN